MSQGSIRDKPQPVSIFIRDHLRQTNSSNNSQGVRALTTDNFILHFTSSFFSPLLSFFNIYSSSLQTSAQEEAADLILQSRLLPHSLRANSHDVAHNVHNVPSCLIPLQDCETFFPLWRGTVCNDLCFCTKWYIIQQSVNNSFTTAASGR